MPRTGLLQGLSRVTEWLGTRGHFAKHKKMAYMPLLAGPEKQLEMGCWLLVDISAKGQSDPEHP